jgi:excisionase family DNA binding protein
LANLSVMPTSAPCRGVSPTIEKLLYDRKSAAYVLSVSLRALDYLIANKQIKVRRIGGKVLIHANELKRFAASDHCGRLAAKAA